METDSRGVPFPIYIGQVERSLYNGKKLYFGSHLSLEEFLELNEFLPCVVVPCAKRFTNSKTKKDEHQEF
jgi:hypothetical protein